MTSSRLVALACLAVLAACSGGSDEPAPVPTTASAAPSASPVPASPVGRWETDAPVAPGRAPSFIEFDAAGTAHGYDGCNRFDKRWRLHSTGSLVLESGLVTLVGCVEPAQIVSGAHAGFIDGDRLTVRDHRGREQVFTRVP